MGQTTVFSSDTAQALSLASAVEISPSGIASRTLLQTPEIRVVLFAFDAGQELTSHTSRRRALAHVITGTCDFFYEGSWHALQPGSLVHLPPSHPHAVRAGDAPCTLLLTLGTELAEQPLSS